MHLYLLNKRGENTNERKELKEMIAGILTEMVADNQAVSTATVTAEEKPVTHTSLKRQKLKRPNS